ncbi:TMhelix containing protein [Vibrio phage 1.289.A._10N.286.55.E8]|nr:TMhelix containing protein [Vibrio phage 1.289.A._10N.286.55.E8]
MIEFALYFAVYSFIFFGVAFLGAIWIGAICGVIELLFRVAERQTTEGRSD